MKKSIIIFLSVLAMTLTFSGCGESEGSATAAPTTEIPTPGVVTPDVEDSVTGETTAGLETSKTRIEEALGVQVPANPGNS